MPWFKLPPENLKNLPLFGIDLIEDQGDYAWYRGEKGRMRVKKDDPQVWFDEIGEADQAGAIGVIKNSL